MFPCVCMYIGKHVTEPCYRACQRRWRLPTWCLCYRGWYCFPTVATNRVCNEYRAGLNLAYVREACISTKTSAEERVLPPGGVGASPSEPTAVDDGTHCGVKLSYKPTHIREN